LSRDRFGLFLRGAGAEDDNFIGHKLSGGNKSGYKCYYYFPGCFTMRLSIWKVGYAFLILAGIIYGFVELRSSQGIPGLLEKRRQVHELELQNQKLHREIEDKKTRIQRLRSDPAEQEQEIRQRLKLVKPGEKVFILEKK